jgi:hypothetical protein
MMEALGGVWPPTLALSAGWLGMNGRSLPVLIGFAWVGGLFVLDRALAWREATR